MLGRQDETVITEQTLEDMIVDRAREIKGPILFQASSQNIEPIVSFYRAATRLSKLFVMDIYTANVLYESDS